MKGNSKEKSQLLSNYVYEELRKSIVSGELKPGVRLIVQELSGKFGTSQAPIREALGRLKQDGLIVGKDNKGSVVSDISLNEIEQLYDLRQLIEVYAVLKSLDSISDKDIEHLEQIYREMKQEAKVNNLTAFISLDMQFHEFFYERCGNQAVLKVWQHIKLQLMRFMYVSNLIYFTNIEEVADFHVELLNGLKSRNKILIEKLFTDHMKTVWWRIKETKTDNKYWQ